MRKLSFILIVILALSTVVYGEMPQKKKVEKLFISLSGMTCENCVKTVTDALKSVKGVSKAEVSLEKMMAYVEFTPRRTNLNKLEAAILASGFGANDRSPEQPHVHDEAEHTEHDSHGEHGEMFITLIGDGDMKYTCPMEECMVFSATPDANCTSCGMKLREMTEKDKDRLKKLKKEYKVKKVKK